MRCHVALNAINFTGHQEPRTAKNVATSPHQRYNLYPREMTPIIHPLSSPAQPAPHQPTADMNIEQLPLVGLGKQ